MLNALVTLAAETEEAPNPLLPAWYDIVWSSVCFIIILFIFWRGALPRLKKMLDERSAAIEGNIAKADDAQRRAEAALAEYTPQLADARKEAGEIRDAARDDGKQIVAEAKDTATAEAARLTASAHAQIEAERQAALVSLRSEVGTLAIDLAGGVIGESLSDDKRAQAVVDRFGAAFRPVSLALLTTAVAQRWSSSSDLVDGIEELAVRAAARSDATADVEGELFRFSRTVAANPELELAL